MAWRARPSTRLFFPGTTDKALENRGLAPGGRIHPERHVVAAGASPCASIGSKRRLICRIRFEFETKVACFFEDDSDWQNTACFSEDDT
jgi:hypothetical protein